MGNYYTHAEIYDKMQYPGMQDRLKKYYKEVLAHTKIKTIHDVSFGTGNLSACLGEMGYIVSGSDISIEMLDRAKEKHGDKFKLYQSDFRFVSNTVGETFDCVMSTGNSLAHVANEDIPLVLAEMDKMVAFDGYLYIDSRNWDKIKREKKRFYTYPPVFHGDERINYVQVWDHEDTSITFNFLYTYEKENKIIGQDTLHETYFPFERKMMEDHLKSLGYSITKLGSYLHAPGDIETTDWYFVLAKKGASDE